MASIEKQARVISLAPGRRWGSQLGKVNGNFSNGAKFGIVSTAPYGAFLFIRTFIIFYCSAFMSEVKDDDSMFQPSTGIGGSPETD